MSRVRLKRLIADHQQLVEYVRAHPRLKLLQSEGDPPEKYHLEYRVDSLRSLNGELVSVKTHTVEVVLPRNYPRTPPLCRMLTPVFHPNIAPHAICVGDHWSSGEPLQSIIVRIGELLAFQSYNVKSPLNGEAACWVAENEDRLPLDRVSLLPEEERPVATPPVPDVAQVPAEESTEEVAFEVSAPSDSEPESIQEPRQEPTPPEPAQCVTACPACQKRFKVERAWIGRRTKCPACAAPFEIRPLDGA